VSTHRQWAELLDAVSGPVAGDDSDTLLRHAIDLGLDVAPDTVGCSITEIEHSGYRTPVASGDLALDLDKAQYDAGTGPCMAAAYEQRHQHFDARTDAERFPGFTGAAIERGVRTSISLPLIGTARPAAINLYATSRYAFDDERPRAVADLLARCVSTLMGRPVLPVRPIDVALPATEIEAAQARARVVTGAQTALMGRQHLSRPVAFAVLTQRSRVEGRSIFDVAHDVVEMAGGSS